MGAADLISCASCQDSQLYAAEAINEINPPHLCAKQQCLSQEQRTPSIVLFVLFLFLLLQGLKTKDYAFIVDSQ